MPKPIVNIGVNWPRDIRGMVNGFCPGREWKDADGRYHEPTWRAYLAGLPRGAYTLVNYEDDRADPRINSAADVRASLDLRVELHRVLRRDRSDLINADLCGPCPISDTPGPVHGDGPMLRRWRAGNAVTVPPLLPHLYATAVELYHSPRPGRTLAQEGEDFRRFRDANVAEMTRWADGRPRIGVVCLRTKGGPRGWGVYVGDDIARAMLDELAPLVDAIAVWDCQFEPGGKALPATPYATTDPVLARVRAFAGAAA